MPLDVLIEKPDGQIVTIPSVCLRPISLKGASPTMFGIVAAFVPRDTPAAALIDTLPPESFVPVGAERVLLLCDEWHYHAHREDRLPLIFQLADVQRMTAKAIAGQTFKEDQRQEQEQLLAEQQRQREQHAGKFEAWRQETVKENLAAAAEFEIEQARAQLEGARQQQRRAEEHAKRHAQQVEEWERRLQDLEARHEKTLASAE